MRDLGRVTPEIETAFHKKTLATFAVTSVGIN